LKPRCYRLSTEGLPSSSASSTRTRIETHPISNYPAKIESSSASSTRTRIETDSIAAIRRRPASVLRALHPREQGLKLGDIRQLFNPLHLRALHPREQGLKPHKRHTITINRTYFERFIHENKD